MLALFQRFLILHLKQIIMNGYCCLYTFSCRYDDKMHIYGGVAGNIHTGYVSFLVAVCDRCAFRCTPAT